METLKKLSEENILDIAKIINPNIDWHIFNAKIDWDGIDVCSLDKKYIFQIYFNNPNKYFGYYINLDEQKINDSTLFQIFDYLNHFTINLQYKELNKIVNNAIDHLNEIVDLTYKD